MGNKTLMLIRRLLVLLGLVSFLGWGVIATLNTRTSIHELHELYDVHLALMAKAFLHLMDPDNDQQHTLPATLSSAEIEQLFDSWPDLPERPTVSDPKRAATASTLQPAVPQGRPPEAKPIRYGNRLRYQLWRDDGSLLFRSDNAPTIATTETAGFSDTTDPQGLGWRHYSVHDQHHGVRIIVSEPHDFRSHLVRNLIMSAATPLVLGLPLLFGLLWLSIRTGLSPLARLSQDIAQRQADQLTPINAQNVPGEVQPIVLALNGLLQRVAETLAHERRFTDNAAHQLRTPLAAIQAHLYAVRHTVNPAVQGQALDLLQQTLERAIRLVNQLLTLARLDPKPALPDFQAIQLADIAEAVCAELAPLALQKDQTLSLLAPPGLPLLMGNADLLSMLIANLLDNAIHYTGRAGQIEISLSADMSGLTLMVRDDGPGIAPEQRERVFERFYRFAPHDQTGTGLGLPICQRIAQLHQASITLSEGLGGRGLGVSVKFLTSTQTIH